MTRAAATARVILSSLLLLTLALIAACLLPPTAHAQDSEKTVRVGWYDSTFNTMDQTGHRSGYAYEYQLKLSAYAGWKYEYVSGSWSQLMHMLETGEIDLMSDVSYTPERATKMLFPSLPMGTEEYRLFIAPTNHEIDPSNVASLDGKRVGVNESSIQADFYKEWAQRQGVQAQLIEVSTTEDQSLRMLDTGELDAYVTVDSFVRPELAVPVWKVGSSDFYFVVSNKRPDLFVDLENAMSKIQDENRYYNQEMFEKYIKRAGANVFLPTDETEWIASHGPIRVGYQDNYLAFCAKDKTTGELTGALKDILAYASNCPANAHLEFEPVAYDTSAAAFEALRNGELDCVFPANLDGYDGESMGLAMTPAVTSTDIYAVVRQADQKAFVDKEHVVVAVDEGNPNYEAFLRDHFPDWRKVYYPNTEECLKAVASNVADCVLMSNYRYNNVSRLCERYHLVSLGIGVDMDYSFAVGNSDKTMYSILAKMVNLVPDTTVNAAISHYITEDAKLTFVDFIMDNLGVVTAVIAIILMVILFLMIRSMRAERKANELISATEIDKLTGLYNRSFFFQYANRMFEEHPETPMDAIVLNIERFHSVNALSGRMFGDQVLRALGNEVHEIAKESNGIAGRFEADRFDIYRNHAEDYQAVFDRLQSKLDDLAPNANVQLRMGVMPWKANLEPVQMFDRARAACSMARGHYNAHLIVYNEALRERELLEQRLLNDLRQALDSYEFEVYFQPKFDIQSDPPQFVGAEALVRWRHPELGMIGPDDFIPLFERSGQIGAVDKYVWEEAARQISRWRELYGVTVPVSVNLSRVDVFDPKLEKTLDEVLQQNGLTNDVFKLEVTESAYTENAELVIQVVESLREKGYEVGMDDFGTGYSSLNMLSVMPIDVLKMDRMFIRDMEQDERGTRLVALIVDIAKSLKIPVVAEGVETKEQLTILKDLGCEMVQGYYFSRPLPSSDFEDEFVRKQAEGR